MDLMMRRNALLACGKRNRLPSEYQEVKYVESTGTQAILTDIPCQLPLQTDFDLMFSYGNDSYFCGTRYRSYGDGEIFKDIRICSSGNYTNNVQWAFGTYRITTGIVYDVRYKLSTYLNNENQSIIKDGDVIGTYNYALPDNDIAQMTGNLGLFAMWISTTKKFGQFTKAKCYGGKIGNGERLLGNFIPCYRKSDGEIGMYDTVSKTFYTNAGTGTFLKGADV